MKAAQQGGTPGGNSGSGPHMLSGSGVNHSSSSPQPPGGMLGTGKHTNSLAFNKLFFNTFNAALLWGICSSYIKI